MTGTCLGKMTDAAIPRSFIFSKISALRKGQAGRTLKNTLAIIEFRRREVVRATFGLRCRCHEVKRRRGPIRRARAEHAKLRQVCQSPSRLRRDRHLSLLRSWGVDGYVSVNWC